MEENINQEVQTEQEAPVEKEKPKAEGEGEKKKYTPIKCARCGNKDLRYVAEYHKCIKLRVVVKIVQLIFFVSIFFTVLPILPTIMAGGQTVGNTLMQTLISASVPVWSGIIYAILSLSIYVLESETHVKCICPECGATWNHIN